MDGEGATAHGVVVHYSRRFPVILTACGIVAPSTSHWQFVTCPQCLEYRPPGPTPRGPPPGRPQPGLRAGGRVEDSGGGRKRDRKVPTNDSGM